VIFHVYVHEFEPLKYESIMSILNVTYKTYD